MLRVLHVLQSRTIHALVQSLYHFSISPCQRLPRKTLVNKFLNHCNTSQTRLLYQKLVLRNRVSAPYSKHFCSHNFGSYSYGQDRFNRWEFNPLGFSIPCPYIPFIYSTYLFRQGFTKDSEYHFRPLSPIALI